VSAARSGHHEIRGAAPIVQAAWGAGIVIALSDPGSEPVVMTLIVLHC